jgi:hypothetical protein
LGRLSYLAPLLANCPEMPTGVNARDVADSYVEADPKAEQLKLLVSYAHLSELMPTVHRGYFSVSGAATTSFELSHSSPEFADVESEDILLSELALPFPLTRSPSFPKAVKGMAESAPTLDMGRQMSICKQLYSYYAGSLFELPLVDDASLAAQFGVTHSDFVRSAAQ